MDKKSVADKRNKSRKYKNPKYNKITDTVVDKSKQHQNDDHKTKSQPILEDIIPNNWSRYELTNDDENFKSEGADYETLLLAPVSIDSHFKFKSEQNWDEDIKSQLNLSKYFTLNIALLNEGISCVPFIERHGYDDAIFSPLELETMKSTSEANLKKYNKLLERKFPQKSDIVITKVENISEPLPNIKNNYSSIKNEEITPDIKENIIINNEPQIPEDDVDDLLNLKCADLDINKDELEILLEDPLLEKIELGKVIAPQQPTVELEQWLDDILDD